MNKFKRLVALTALASTLSGCMTIGGIDATKLPLVSALTQKEIIDYYKQSLSYDTIAKRNLSVQKLNFETKDVNEETKTKLVKAQDIVEQGLISNTYNAKSVLTENQFGYIKYVIDDKILINKGLDKASTALGYYFVDIKYDITPKPTGTFTGAANYLGINGAFMYKPNEAPRLNSTFIELAGRLVNDYIKKNGTSKSTTLDIPENVVAPPVNTDSKVPVGTINTETNTDKETVNTGENTESNKETPSNTKEETKVIVDKSSIKPIQGRRPSLSIDVYNKAIGGSLSQSAFMPTLGMVYTAPAQAAGISGYGIFPQGNYSMQNFGYSRSNLKGQMILRYVFKENISKQSSLDFISVYTVSIELSNSVQTEKTIVPEFVEGEIKKLIEKSDRALSNNDLSALMGGHIYQDMGVAVLNGYYQNTSYLMRHVSNLNSILIRKGNSYLIEVESMIQEGPKGTNSYGTYKDTYQMVIEQIGTEFVINDYVCVKREIVKEPQPELDNSITRRLVSLGLSGNISDSNKNSIKELLTRLYTSSNNRELKGMYASFNNDVSLLSSNHKEYLNDQLRKWLTRYGVDIKSKYEGAVTEWVGGAGNQAEVITEEIIQYQNKDTAQYMQMYYLISNYKDTWVIDEMRAIEIKDVKTEEAVQILERIRK